MVSRKYYRSIDADPGPPALYYRDGTPSNEWAENYGIHYRPDLRQFFSGVYPLSITRVAKDTETPIEQLREWQEAIDDQEDTDTTHHQKADQNNPPAPEGGKAKEDAEAERAALSIHKHTNRWQAALAAGDYAKADYHRRKLEETVYGVAPAFNLVTETQIIKEVY